MDDNVTKFPKKTSRPANSPWDRERQLGSLTHNNKAKVCVTGVKHRSGFFGIDVRIYWLPPGEEDYVPTRKGLALTRAQWTEIAKMIAEAPDATP